MINTNIRKTKVKCFIQGINYLIIKKENFEWKIQRISLKKKFKKI